MDTRITKIRVKNHFAYSAWKYVLLAVVAVFGWNLIYTTTAYHPPKNKKVDVYFATPSLSQESLDAFKAMTAPVFPDMEELNFLSIAMNTEDDYYGTMQMTTYIGAQEGDLYFMNKDRFRGYLESGAFLDLSAAVADGRIQLGDIDVQGGWGVDEEGNRGLFGIPATSLYGLLDYGVDNRKLVISVMAYTQNEENAIKMVNWFIQTMKAERPEWMDALEEREKQEAIQQPDTVLPSY